MVYNHLQVTEFSMCIYTWVCPPHTYLFKTENCCGRERNQWFPALLLPLRKLALVWPLPCVFGPTPVCMAPPLYVWPHSCVHGPAPVCIAPPLGPQWLWLQKPFLI